MYQKDCSIRVTKKCHNRDNENHSHTILILPSEIAESCSGQGRSPDHLTPIIDTILGG
jgi:hypothetical protein